MIHCGYEGLIDSTRVRYLSTTMRSFQANNDCLDVPSG